MDPITLSALMSAPSLVQGIMGLFTPQRDPLQERTRSIQALLKILGPEGLTTMLNKMFSSLKASPMYQSGVNNIVQGAQQSSNILNRNLAAAGMNDSGVGIIKKSLGPSVLGGQLTDFNSGIYSMGNQILSPMLQGILGGAASIADRSNDPYNLGGLAKGIANTNWNFLLPNSNTGYKPTPGYIPQNFGIPRR